MTSLALAELFTRDIHRTINGVIKAEQNDADTHRQELEEYVITEELDRHFRSFYNYFNHSASGDKNGVWISGFFGSGKSHFLKMLGYLLDNQIEVDGKKPLDFFEDKVKSRDALLWAEMKKPLDDDLQVALFNIDSKARSDSQRNKDSILNVFWRVFDDLRGYFGEAAHIAQMEAYLDHEGLLESFAQSFERIKGESWQSKRRGHAFLGPAIAQALQEVTGQSEPEARQILKSLKDSIGERSVESFAKDIQAYLETPPGQKQKRLVFLVDEVGQYIGDDAGLMLNLQTVVEDLNIHCGGKAWVIVTSQEDIDSILKHVNQSRRNDFSKIQGRFYTPLSLSSANTDEVIKKRLLTKTALANDALLAFYGQQEANLNNLISFSQDTAFFPRYKGSQDFIDTYPFLPYQFTLLQEVLRSVRESGSSGRHMAEGERSMLDMFQHTLKQLDSQPLGVLVPFYHFYDAIHGFLDHTIRRVFAQATENERLEQPFDLNLLKVLFMVRWVEKFKPKQDNLLTLMIDHVDADKAALRQQVQASLERLEQQTLIQRNGDAYYFLTNEQQEIMRTIKSLAIDPMEVNQRLEKLMWGNLMVSKQLKYDDRHSYDFRRKVDDIESSASKKAVLLLHLITPAGGQDIYNEDAQCQTQTQDMQTVLVRLPADQGLYAQVQQVLQTEQYFIRHGAAEGSTHTKRLRQQLSDDKQQREKELLAHFEQLICQADVFAGGEKLQQVNRQTVKDLCQSALRSLVQAVYTKLDQVGRHYASEAEVDAAFSPREQTEHALPEHDGNAAARASLSEWCSEQQELRGQTITVELLLNRFSDRPFGWSELDIMGILAEWVATGKLELLQNQERVSPGKGFCRQLLSGTGRKSFVVRLQRQVPAAVLLTARDLFKLSAEGKSPASESEALFQQYQSLLPRQAQELAGFLARSQPAYPFHQTLQALLVFFERLQAFTQHPDFFAYLHKQAETYENYADDLSDLQGFYNHQYAIFDKNQALLEQLAPEMVHLSDATLQSNFDKARQALAAPAHQLLKLLPQVGHLLKPVEDQLSHLRESHRQQVMAALDASLALLKSTYAADLDSLTPYWQRWESLREEVAQASSIDSIVARQGRLDGLEQQVHDAIQQQAQAAQAAQVAQANQAAQAAKAAQASPSPPADSAIPATPFTADASPAPDTVAIIAPPPVLPVSKPVEMVYPVRLAAKSLLETEDDVQRYLETLGIELRKHLRANKRVQLK